MLTIGQVASRAGLRASAVRYYEAQGLLPAASRRGGKRVYDASILERLAVIALAKMAGFEVHEIRDALSRIGDGQPALTWKTLGEAKSVALVEQISRLARTKDVLTKLVVAGARPWRNAGARSTGLGRSTRLARHLEAAVGGTARV